MSKVLAKKFYGQNTLSTAKKLLGKFLVRRIGRRKISGTITEVEAYIGPKDKASHASRGRTKRTEVMFGESGHWYVYLIYGMHYCLNIVTEKKNYPAAILIRGVKTKTKEIRGPGRVCKYFWINKSFNAAAADRKIGLWIENSGVKIKNRDIQRGKRIGVDYAGKWKNKLWRFYLVRK